MRSTWSLLFLMIPMLSGMAQEVTITGKVTGADLEPLAGATIRVLNTSKGVATDDGGNFSLVLSPGRYHLLVSAVGHASADKVIQTADANELVIVLGDAYRLLDDVIVTAQKEEQNNQSVPFSTTALPSHNIEAYRIWNTDDLTSIIPNMYSANPGDNRNVTSIRGITSSSYDPAVTTYIDGVNQFSLDTYLAPLFDVAQIEVLRGPQGTLYGRNSMGGVINIHTRRPDGSTTGFASASLGSYAQQRYSGGVRAPLVKDQLFIGLAGLYDGSNGFYDNAFDNSNFDKRHSLTGNAFITWLPATNWTLTLNGKYHAHRNLGAFPLKRSVVEAFAEPFSVNQNAVGELVDDILNGSFQAMYQGDALNFTSLTTYQSNYRYYKDPLDADFMPSDILTIIDDYGRDWNHVEVLTEELRIASPAGHSGPLSWTAGTYLFSQRIPFRQATHFGEDAALISPSTNYAIINTATGKNRGVALFGQGTYSISPRWAITAGLRYDYEHKDQSALAEYQPDGNPAFTILPDTAATTSYNAFSPKVSISYQANDRSFFYVLYSRGFRAGGLTALSPDPSQGSLYAFDPEHSNNFEGGAKNRFMGDRLQLNVAIFHTQVSDAQVPTLILPEAVTVTRNAGELTSSGIELEATATPATGLEFSYSGGYTHATYDRLQIPVNGNETDFHGNHQVFTPDVTSMMAAQYATNIDGKKGTQFVVRGEWMYLGAQYFDLANAIRQPAYSLMNASIGIRARTFELLLWGRNLADEKYIAYAYDFGAAHLGNPRNWGVTITKRFGVVQ